MGLPELATDHNISPEEVRLFQGAGHILLRGVATPEEAAAYRPVILNAREMYGPVRTPIEQRDTYGKAFLKGMNLWTKDERVRRFVLARRFAKIAATLLGVKGVRVYHDQALIKEPGGGITPWHQDQHYWPLDTSNTVTMWMPLVDVTSDMGTLRFATGSHREGYLGDLPISSESEERLEAHVQSRRFSEAESPSMKAGDATFHGGWTLHSAPENSTNRAREVMTIIWFEDGARVIAPDNASQARDLERWLPGLRPGDVAASHLNPLCWRAEEASVTAEKNRSSPLGTGRQARL